MGRKGTYPGVEDNGGTLRVTFSLDGERCREPLNLEPTPANWIKAAKLRREIIDKIRLGVFSYAEYFPHSARARGGAKTFGQAAQEWLNLKADLARSTQYGYEKVLNTYWMQPLGQRALRAITPGELQRVVIAAGFKSAKTHNNAISPLKMVFEYCVGEKYLDSSPAEKVGWRQHIRPEPDPYTLEEVRAILAEMTGADFAYFRYAFFSGVRASEQIALKWPKVDFRRGEVRVDEANVMGQDKPTKTYERRYVEMNSEARAALEDQRKRTQLAYEHVFIDPITKAPYVDHKPPRLVLQRVVKKLGIRYRPLKQTRHTFATLNLMAGAHPMWVAKQLGHKTMQITLTIYSKWIEGADKGRERAKLEAVLGQSVGQSGQSQGSSEGE